VLTAAKRRVLDLVASATHGTMRLDAVHLRELLIPCPDLETQSLVATAVRSRLACARAMLDDSLRQVGVVEALPSALLEGVFGGFEMPNKVAA
jgi:hypothetical protein